MASDSIFLGLKIDSLLEEEDEIAFFKSLKDLEKWSTEVSCDFSKGFCSAMFLSLNDKENGIIETKRLLKKNRKEIKKYNSVF